MKRWVTVFYTTTWYSQILAKVVLYFWKEALFFKIIYAALNRYMEVFFIMWFSGSPGRYRELGYFHLLHQRSEA